MLLFGRAFTKDTAFNVLLEEKIKFSSSEMFPSYALYLLIYSFKILFLEHVPIIYFWFIFMPLITRGTTL